MTARDDFYKQFQEYLRIVYEGRWIMMAIFIIIVTATWFYTMQQDDIYQATATVRLKRALDPLNTQSFQGLGAQDLGWGSERIIQNEMRVIKSEEVADRVANELLKSVPEASSQLDTLPIIRAQSRPSTLRKIARKLSLENFFISLGLAQVDTSSKTASKGIVAARAASQVSAMPVTGLDFINIIAESTSPREAAQVANLTMEAYRFRNIETARENVTTARAYLESQLDSKRDSLKLAENELRTFQQVQGMVSLDDETQSVISQVSSFEAQREQAQIELGTNTKILNELKRQLREVEPTSGKKIAESADPILRQLQSDKATLEMQMQKAEFSRKEYSSKRPELDSYFEKNMKGLRQRYHETLKKLDEVTKQIVESADITGDPIDYSRELRQKIIAKQIEIETTKAKINGLDKTIAEYSRKFDLIPAQSIEFARLERKRLSFDKLSGLLDEKFQEVVINEQTTLGNVDIIDRATVPSRPVRPNRPLNMLIGVLVALGLGLAIAFGLHYLDNTIRNPEDVEKLGIPVLTFVPSFGASDKLGRAESLVTLTAPQSPPSESYRTLRTSLVNSVMNEDGKALVFVVTSPAPKEGKSTAIANLAVSSASSERRVLLIDADLRRPVQHTIFEVDREPGLSNCLVGEAAVNLCIKKTGIPGLHVATCGHIPSHPAELLGSTKMQRFINLVRQHYDIVLIDSPPVIAMADTLVIARYCDGVALVVSADSTKTVGLEKAKELLEANNAKVLGVVVNRFNANKIYYSYYRYYYQNYYYYSDNGEKKKRLKAKV